MASKVPLEALLAPGIFETLKVSEGRCLALHRHLDRLVASAHSASPSFRVQVDRIRKELLQEVEGQHLREATVRLTLVALPEDKTLSFTIMKPPRKIPVRFFQKGISVETTATRRNALASLSGEIKAKEFHNGLLSVFEGLGRKKIFERITLTQQGYVCEGTITNLFILKGRELATPPSYLGVLAGVTRSLVLELGERLGLETMERPFTRFELYTAEEAFLTNTSLGILPVTKADGRVIGDGKVGPGTKRVREAYADAVSRKNI